MFTLIIEDKHGGIADEYSFEEGEFYIGRSHTSDIILPSDNVSRRHARLYTVDGKCYIEDLSSSNGVFVNGRRIHQVYQIQRSAQIKVGDYYLHIESDADHGGDEDKTWCKLTGRNLAFTNQVFRVQRKVNLIGRGKDCTLTIIDPSVSRIHTKLSVERSGALTIEDLKSSNGTFLNDERIEVATVHHRDIVRFGNVEFLVEIPEQENAPPAAKQTKEARRERPRTEEREREREPRGGGERERPVPAPAALAAASMSNDKARGAAAEKRSPFEDWEPTKKGGGWLVWVIVGGFVLVIGAILIVAFREQIFGGGGGTVAPVTKVETPAPPVDTRPPPPSAEDLAREAAAEKDKKAKELQAIVDAGKDHIRGKRWDLALERFQAALERDPLNEEAQRGANHVKMESAAKLKLDEARRLRDALKRGEAAKMLREIDDASVYHGEAQDELAKLLEAKPTLMLTADNLLREKDCAGAIATLKELQQIDPKDSEVGDKMAAAEALVGSKKCNP